MNEGIQRSVKELKAFFETNRTRSLEFRRENLRKFRQVIVENEKMIAEALWKDLRKSPEEAYYTEISIVTGEIGYHLKNLERWAKPARVTTPLHLLPSSSRIIYEPLGVALIMAPWNYPFQLLMNSLVGALSSGCCALLKPSPYAPETAKVMEFLIRKIFPPEYVDVVQGGREVNELLLQQRFDFIFFTGSPAVGKVVMRAASEHLTKVVLELGGKSPCIVDAGADIAVAAQRIIWGKTINAGQTCIAPDYLFVHRSVKVQLIEKIKESVERMFGKDVQQSKFYPRIVHDQAFLRLEKYLLQGNILVGGQTDRGDRFIAPTVMDKVDPASPLMQDEIFGPILPVMEFDNLDEVIQFINQREKPLAFYYFGKNDKAKEIFARTTSGGGCINDTLMHITNHHMPFGGVGNSGLGKYHGRESFLAFSNARAVVSTPVWIDLPMKYPPFKYFNLVRKIV
jgi:aldehyde dehydrogenase (NAD+)